MLGQTLDAVASPPSVALDSIAATSLVGEGGHAWRIPIGSTAGLSSVLEQLLSHRLSSTYEPLVLWWTDGSSAVEPSCLVSRGLPQPSAFAALLDGQWSEARWRPLPATVDESQAAWSHEGTTLMTLRSAARSDVGLSRDVNEDAFLERPDAGLWAVADGLGGHRDGEVASRMVCDGLAEMTAEPTFEGTVYAARRCLQSVNDYLLRTGTRSSPADRSASTVAVLLVRGVDCAILWAGDSRVYRCRSGKLERLTRDHSAEDLDAHRSQEASNVITRAVGVQAALALDQLRDTVSPGDRFLLCTDGLTRHVPESQIEAWIQQGDLDAAVTGLIDLTLAAGAPDNVTVLIAEAQADAV
jgi:type VI secretion system protein ImpM